jgi:hypothetical protein
MDLVSKIGALPQSTSRTNYLKKQYFRLLERDALEKHADDEEEVFNNDIGLSEIITTPNPIVAPKPLSSPSAMSIKNIDPERMTAMELIDFQNRAADFFINNPRAGPGSFDFSILQMLDVESAQLLSHEIHLIHKLLNMRSLPRFTECTCCHNQLDDNDRIILVSANKRALNNLTMLAFHEACYRQEARMDSNIFPSPRPPTSQIPKNIKELLEAIKRRKYPIIAVKPFEGLIAIDIQTRDLQFQTITFDSTNQQLFWGETEIRDLKELEII